VLVEWRTYVENTAPFGVSRVPELLLYATGRLLIKDDGKILTTQLPQDEVCRLLNRIDHTGFYDIDMEPYETEVENLPLGIPSVTRISVKAWRQRTIVAESLRSHIDDPNIHVPSALRDTHRILRDYRSQRLYPYRSKTLALAIHRYTPGNPCTTETRWPLPTYPLGAAYDRARQREVKHRQLGYGLTLDGNEAAQVYRVITEASERCFIEGDNTYRLAARPLLPYESLESAMSYEAEIPSPEISFDTFILECQSDP
jgi:hypothetical protein